MGAMIKVVNRNELWSSWRLFYKANLIGVLSFWILLLIWAFGYFGGLFLGVNIPPYISFIAFCVVIVFVGPFVLFERHRYQIGSTRRAALGGLGFGLGFLITILLLATLIFLTENNIDSRQTRIIVGAYLGSILFLFLSGLVSVVFWLFLRHRRPSVVIQDGTLCPECGYLLIGNVSMQCPECGRAFTLEELGTTYEHLQKGKGETNDDAQVS